MRPVDTFFKITERGSTLAREVRGGVVTFFTMAYIIVLNPLIIGFAQDVNGEYLGGGSEPNLAAIAAGTALVAGVLTILMGLVANYPLALAAGLGLNAFVAYSIAGAPGMTWPDAIADRFGSPPPRRLHSLSGTNPMISGLSTTM